MRGRSVIGRKGVHMVMVKAMREIVRLSRSVGLFTLYARLANDLGGMPFSRNGRSARRRRGGGRRRSGDVADKRTGQVENKRPFGKA